LSSGVGYEHVPKTKALLNLCSIKRGKKIFIPSVTGYELVSTNVPVFK
jgi:hypothetical protein